MTKKKISLPALQKIALAVMGVSFFATLAGVLLASGVLRFGNDAFNDLLLSYIGIISSLIGMTFMAIGWFVYVLVTKEISKVKHEN
jgi:predicted lysophospholipase L1 biosynthesis ABC-type transport system permease subunit